MPVVVEFHVAQMVPSTSWLGGGQVDLKYDVKGDDFCSVFKQPVPHVSALDSNFRLDVQYAAVGAGHEVLLHRFAATARLARAHFAQLLRPQRQFTALDFVQFPLKKHPHDRVVVVLALVILTSHDDVARLVLQHHGARSLVDFLSTGASSFRKRFLQVALVQWWKLPDAARTRFIVRVVFYFIRVCRRRWWRRVGGAHHPHSSRRPRP